MTDRSLEINYQPGDVLCVGSSPGDTPHRQQLIHLLANVPTLMDAVRKMSAGKLFRVVMSKENAHLFKQSADGAYKPFLHNGKHFVENVDLVRASPDYVGAVSNIALLMNMAAVAAKLEAIEVGVRNISRLLADTQRGRAKGALDALALARVFSNPTERRSQMIAAARDAVIELGALTGQLRAHVSAMPRETTGLFDGILRTGFIEANLAFEQVRDDVSLLIDGVGALLRAYVDLEEPSVAREAIGRILDGVRQAALPDAIRKARLLPLRANVVPPEIFICSFLDAVTDMETNLLRIAEAHRPLIALDIQPEELLN